MNNSIDGKNLKQHLNAVVDVLESNVLNDKKDDKKEKSKWFNNNVMMLFSTGMIFDRNDKQLLDQMIDYFNNTNSIFLNCYYKIYDYNSDIVQKLEEMHSIGNGNYHVCCFAICYGEDYSNSPDKQTFNHKGVCAYFTSLNSIRDYMISLIQSYGTVNENKPVHIDKTDVRSTQKFNYKDEIVTDYNIPDKSIISHGRTRIITNVDGIRGHPKNFRREYTQNDKDVISYHNNGSDMKGIFKANEEFINNSNIKYNDEIESISYS